MRDKKRDSKRENRQYADGEIERQRGRHTDTKTERRKD